MARRDLMLHFSESSLPKDSKYGLEAALSRRTQCPLSLRETNFKENNAISHLTDDNIILYPLLPSDTLDQ